MKKNKENLENIYERAFWSTLVGSYISLFIYFVSDESAFLWRNFGILNVLVSIFCFGCWVGVLTYKNELNKTKGLNSSMCINYKEVQK